MFDRKKRSVPMVGRAVIEEQRQGIQLQFLKQRLHEPRLANSRLSSNQHHTPVAAPSLIPTAQQEVDFLSTADQLAPGRMQRVKAVRDGAFSYYPTNTNAKPEFFQLRLIELSTLEQVANEPVCVLLDQDALLIGNGDKTQSGTYGFADEFVLGTRRFLENNETCRNTDARLQRVG